MIKAILVGACGKMGGNITDCAKTDDNIKIVAGIDKIGGQTAALGFELTKAEHVGAHHKLDKLFLCCGQHDRSFLFLREPGMGPLYNVTTLGDTPAVMGLTR